jgi:hypothetical protein
MTYAGGPCSRESHEGIFARVQAKTLRSRCCLAAAAARPLIGTTFGGRISTSSNRFRRNSSPCSGVTVRSHARMILSCKANSTVSLGRSLAVVGGNALSAITTAPDAPRLSATRRYISTVVEGENTLNAGMPREGFVTRASEMGRPFPNVSLWNNVVNPIQPGSRMTSADGPADKRRPPRLRFAGPPNPQRQTTGLSPAAPLPLILGRASFQDDGNLVRLPEGFGVAAPSRLREPVLRRNPNPRLKAHSDNLAHSLVSKPAEPVRPVAVSLQ